MDDLSYLNNTLSKTSLSDSESSSAGTTSPPTSSASSTTESPVTDYTSQDDASEAESISIPDLDFDPADTTSFRDLLSRLDEANLAANGIESRLDELLGTVDGMLKALESSQPSQGSTASESGQEEGAQEKQE